MGLEIDKGPHSGGMESMLVSGWRHSIAAAILPMVEGMQEFISMFIHITHCQIHPHKELVNTSTHD